MKKPDKDITQDVTFTINLHDSDGDCWQKGIFLHFGDQLIVRFEDMKKLEAFREQLDVIIKEIKENWEV